MHKASGVRALFLLALAAGGCSDDDGPVLGGGGSSTGTEGTDSSDGGMGPSGDTPGTGTDPTFGDADSGSGSVGLDSTGADSESGTEGPQQTVSVIITSPATGQMTPGRRVFVRGTVEANDAEVSLVIASSADTQDVTIEDDGSFSVAVELQPGNNTVELVATDADGSEDRAEVEVYFGHRVSVGNSQVGFVRGQSLYTWGRNEQGQLGNGSRQGSGYGDDPSTSALPVRYELTLDNVVSIVTRQTFMVALIGDGTVWSWGSNDNGQLGYDSRDDCSGQPCQQAPVAIPGIADAIAITAGFDHTLILRADGSVLSFGINDLGQLGYQTPDLFSNIPTAVPGLSDIVQLAAGSDSSYALDRDGRIWAWGENDVAQLGGGNASAGPAVEPATVPNLSDVTQIASANDTVFALRTNGTVMAWGNNLFGQAGIGDDADPVLMPTTVVHQTQAGLEPLEDVELIAGDGFVGMALTADGTVYTWGFGALGQLGMGNTPEGERDLDDRTIASPIAVAKQDQEVFDIAEIEVGAGGPAAALGRSGDLFGWGWSFRGSLGLDGAIDAWAYSTPIVIFPAL